MPPYSSSPISTSSPGASSSERTTAFTAELALVANARLSARADVRGERAPRRVEARREAPFEGEELDRLPLQLALIAR